MSEPNWIVTLFLSLIFAYFINLLSHLTNPIIDNWRNKRALKISQKRLEDLKSERDRISEKARNIQDIYLSSLAFILASLLIIIGSSALFILMQAITELFASNSLMQLMRLAFFALLLAVFYYTTRGLDKQVNDLIKLRNLNKYLAELDAQIAQLETQYSPQESRR